MTAERLLNALAPDGGIALDPFVGSGTTLLEAARRGMSAVGFDVNPAAIALARCVCLAAYTPGERAKRLDQAMKVGLAPNGTERLNGSTEIDEAHAVALLAHVDGSPERAQRRLEALLASLPPNPVSVRADLGDARATGLQAGSADVVLTSPPYINVFNYHQYGRPLSDGFGWPILTAARSEIGSNRQNRGNRFRTVIQYSIDMALALAEMARVLRPGRRAVVVVGRESRVRGVSLYNGDLLARIARVLGTFDTFERAERVFVSRFGERIFEDVLVLSNGQPANHAKRYIEQIGRAEGLRALHDCPSDGLTEAEIEAAIEDADKIGPSPLATGTLV
ncbi:MAG TPA: DNA methyltransferase [Solirubrobacteraceae bacterium]|jgi:SAM-dependent methyltransferase